MADQPHFDPAPIIRAMAIHGYTLAAMAAKLGCSKNAVWNITNAKCPRPKYLHEICRALDVEVADCYPVEAKVK